MKHNRPLVLSASRMTDMPAFYPYELIEAVDQRIASGVSVHTVVLWTKHPASLFTLPLYDALLRWKKDGIQLAVQVTVTGFGGVIFNNHEGRQVMIEPNVPAPAGAMALFPQLVTLVGHPDLIAVRFDPLMKVWSSHMALQSNLSMAPTMVASMADAGLKSLIYSFLEPGIYRKVDRRFSLEALGMVEFDAAEKTRIRVYLEGLGAEGGISVKGCCVTGANETACVDGAELARIKGDGALPDARALHRRPGCGCTKSTDLGGWPPKPCSSGCLYCYARPHRQ